MPSESTSGVLISAEYTAGQGAIPEEIGRNCALLLLQEVRKGKEVRSRMVCSNSFISFLCAGGVIDTTHQSLVLLLMVLSPEDVCKVRVGQLGEPGIAILRLVREFFGTVFKVKEDLETDTVLLSCLGTGYRNISRRVT